MNTTSKRVPDAAGLMHEWGLEAQAVALTMWKHEITQPLGICRACGRLPARDLPQFGPRCAVAAEQWERADAAIRRLLSMRTEDGDSQGRVIGRASVPVKRG